MMRNIHWFHGLEAALMIAHDTGRPLFIDVWSTTCYGCAKMMQVTFLDKEVIHFLNDHFVAVKLNYKEAVEDTRQVVEPYKLTWMPTFIVRDPRMIEVRRTNGYLPPKAFLAELSLALGLVHQTHRQYEQAHRRFVETAEQFSETHIAPEALYWAGIASYYQGVQSLERLQPYWSQLAERYPQNIWAQRADVLDVQIGEEACVAGSVSRLRWGITE